MPGTEAVDRSLTVEENELSNGHQGEHITSANGEVSSPNHEEVSSADHEEVSSTSHEEVSSPNQEDVVASVTQENERLSQEIVSFREENERLVSLREENESIARSTIREAEERKMEVLGEIKAVRKEIDALRQEKTELHDEKVALVREKERVEGALTSANRNVSELSKKVDDAESAAAAAKEKVAGLERENKVLSENYLGSKSRCETLEVELDKAKVLGEALEIELDDATALAKDLKLQNKEQERELERAKEELGNIKVEMESLENKEHVLKLEASTLEEKLAASSAREAALKTLRDELASALREREADIVNLERDVCEKMYELDGVSREMKSLKEAKAGKEEQLQELSSRNKSLEKEVQHGLTKIQTLQETAAVEQAEKRALVEQVASLENAVAAAGERDTNGKVELLRLEQKVKNLETSLGNVKEEAVTSEKKVWQLMAELTATREQLEQRSSARSYALPTAMVTVGTLAAAGVFTYFRNKPQSSSSSS